ncbi:helix-turn-helix transcriptional regulator [Paraburkholderia caffeinitolerans]|uniref:helix-turn-helix transcriptional regulator n=1 Tax=Paraburkholderia caffeinitolerans TaxID=1723730 RepID=UPI00158287C0|nr:LuxR C-terminal-related transcriptional regulator [Paraburkholderia caffeinitolerans]
MPLLCGLHTGVVRGLRIQATSATLGGFGLSPETVTWHLTNIYSKFGVSGRDEAVERVRDMEGATQFDAAPRAAAGWQA